MNEVLVKSYKRVLTIAGSDSGGGAGVQADLKTFSACGCYGMSAITAITAQNTCGVLSIHPVPMPILADQIRAVLDDIGCDAIKIGMLHSAECVATVAKILREYKCHNVVIDPVMVATSGDKLIQDEAIAALSDVLLPLATLVTPNLPELELLVGQTISDTETHLKAGSALKIKLKVSVLAKGGHLAGTDLTDYLCALDKQMSAAFPVERIQTPNTHGTGCTLSSAIASYLAHGYDIKKSVELAEDYLHSALRAGAKYTIGKGCGPVHHFHAFWQ